MIAYIAVRKLYCNKYIPKNLPFIARIFTLTMVHIFISAQPFTLAVLNSSRFIAL